MFSKALQTRLVKTAPLPTSPFTPTIRNLTTSLRKTAKPFHITPSLHTPTLLPLPHAASTPHLHQIAKRGYLFRFIRIMYRSVVPYKEQVQANTVPDPYYGKYTPRRDPIPEGYWTQNPYGKPYFVGNTPEQEKLIEQAKTMKLYDGREHPFNPTRLRDPWEMFTLGIPGKYFGYAVAILWMYMFWEIAGRRMNNATSNWSWRHYYLFKLDRFYPLNFTDDKTIHDNWPTFLLPPTRESLLPAVTDEEIAEFNKPKPVVTEEEKQQKKDEEEAKKKQEAEDKKNAMTAWKAIKLITHRTLLDAGIIEQYTLGKELLCKEIAALKEAIGLSAKTEPEAVVAAESKE